MTPWHVSHFCTAFHLVTQIQSRYYQNTMASIARQFDITVTIGWIKGLQVSDHQIQAVWEAFGLPHQTELQKITPIFDAQTGNTGMATWNESFEIQDLVVESEEVECYLEVFVGGT